MATIVRRKDGSPTELKAADVVVGNAGDHKGAQQFRGIVSLVPGSSEARTLVRANGVDTEIWLHTPSIVVVSRGDGGIPERWEGN